MTYRRGSIISPRPVSLAHLSTRAVLAAAPQPVNWFTKPADLDVLGNDKYGDCDPVADFRLIQLWGGQCTKQLALTRYTQLTSFDPAVPSTDQGTNTNLDLKAWCSFPIWDGLKAYPIYWAQVDPTDMNQVLRALQRFPLLITICLPAAVEQDPDSWASQPGKGSQWAPRFAHRVLLGGWDGKYFTVYTWGMHVTVSTAMMTLFLTGGIVDVAIPHSSVAPDELDLDGIDFDALSQDLDALHLIEST